MSRRLAIWIAIIVVFVALIASVASAGESAVGTASPLKRNGVTYSGSVAQEGDSDRQIALISINGTIVNGDSSANGSATGGDDIVRLLEAIEDDKDRFDGVIIELNTGGGAVLASAEMEAAVRHLRAKTGLPVLAWMRDAAASGGYYVSAAADRIIAAPATFTGSIGVILQYQEFQGLADKYGVRDVTIKSGKLKDIGSPFKHITAEERAVLQSVIDEAYGEFVTVVARGRDMSEADVREIADGRIYTGTQGKANGLVDELGLRREAYDAMAKLLKDRDGVKGEELDIVRFNRTYSLFESLAAGAQPTLDSLAAAKAAGAVLRGDGVVAGARVADNGFAKIEYRAQIG